MRISLPVVLSVFAVLLLSFSITATANMIIPANDNAKSAPAPEKSPAIDRTPDGSWDLVRADFIHYVKPNGAHATASASCYKLLGVKWGTLPVNYVINPVNSGLDEAFVTSTIYASAEAWDAATSRELLNDAYGVDYTVAYGVQDYVNAIDFGGYPDSNVIAVTSVWYTRIGKRIVEFDMRFNTRFAWGDATVDSTKMDLQNIATHELGHGVGMGDVYTSVCSAVTMYGYSGYGETSKRSLEQPDVAGLQKMYGA